eukprot:4897897-Alexandrium_andersonii.AAC.1
MGAVIHHVQKPKELRFRRAGVPGHLRKGMEQGGGDHGPGRARQDTEAGLDLRWFRMLRLGLSRVALRILALQRLSVPAFCRDGISPSAFQ